MRPPPDTIDRFMGLDVGKRGHHVVVLDRDGHRQLDRTVLNDEAALQAL